MPTKPATIDEYLNSLPPDRRDALNQVRKVMRKNLDPKFEEGIQYGMIGYYVPHKIYPNGYHCDPKQPLPFAALGSQKNYMSLHLMCLYVGGAEDSPAAKLNAWFQDAWSKTGKKLDMGKACVRFKKTDDLALDVIAELVKRVPAARYIEQIEAVAALSKKARAAKK